MVYQDGLSLPLSPRGFLARAAVKSKPLFWNGCCCTQDASPHRERYVGERERGRKKSVACRQRQRRYKSGESCTYIHSGGGGTSSTKNPPPPPHATAAIPPAAGRGCILEQSSISEKFNFVGCTGRGEGGGLSPTSSSSRAAFYPMMQLRMQ